MEDIASVEQFIITLLTLAPTINADEISYDLVKEGVSALLYCTQYNNIKRCTWAGPFDFHRSWNSNSENNGELMFSFSREHNQNDALDLDL
jgi:hypothetical protein